jgi:hypothetical protein
MNGDGTARKPVGSDVAIDVREAEDKKHPSMRGAGGRRDERTRE